MVIIFIIIIFIIIIIIITCNNYDNSNKIFTRKMSFVLLLLTGEYGLFFK